MTIGELKDLLSEFDEEMEVALDLIQNSFISSLMNRWIKL